MKALWRKKGKKENHSNSRDESGKVLPNGIQTIHEVLPIELMLSIFLCILNADKGGGLQEMVVCRLVCSEWNCFCLDASLPVQTLLLRKRQEQEFQHGNFTLSSSLERARFQSKLVGSPSRFFTMTKTRDAVTVSCWIPLHFYSWKGSEEQVMDDAGEAIDCGFLSDYSSSDSDSKEDEDKKECRKKLKMVSREKLKWRVTLPKNEAHASSHLCYWEKEGVLVFVQANFQPEPLLLLDHDSGAILEETCPEPFHFCCVTSGFLFGYCFTPSKHRNILLPPSSYSSSSSSFFPFLLPHPLPLPLPLSFLPLSLLLTFVDP